MIPVIVLAGGEGSRFGSNKLLAELDGLPLALHTPLRLQEAGGFAVTLVTCHEEVRDLCLAHGLDCLYTRACREGLSGSVRAAAERLAEQDVPAAVFCAGDQPFLGTCMAGGRPTNPAVFSAPYFAALTRLTGDTGGRAVLREHPEDCFVYELADGAEAADIDVPEQLENAKRGEMR